MTLTSKDRQALIQRYKKLQYYRALAKVQYQFRDMFKNKDFDQYAQLPSSLREDQLKQLVASERAIMKSVPKAGDRKVRVQAIAQDQIRTILNMNNGRRSAYVKCGPQVSMGVSKFRSGNDYNIVVGWMWTMKVFNTLYRQTTKDLGPWFILSATKLRVNDRNIDLYGVTAFNRNTETTTQGYVAQTKTPAKNTTFAVKAPVAVKRANEMLSKEMNYKILGSNEESEND